MYYYDGTCLSSAFPIMDALSAIDAFVAILEVFDLLI